MKIKYANTSNCKICLELSLPVEIMTRFARLVNPDYDIYKRLGLKEDAHIFYKKAAECIVSDMVQDGYYIDFVETLVRIDREGYMGRRYDLKGLNNVVASLVKEGYIFDKVSGLFFENNQENISPGWGRLKEGEELKIALLRLDIAGNSTLVRNNPRSKIEQAYNDIRDIVNRTVTGRHGRIWSWEGDGALAAFLFGSMEKMAVYAGMEILQDILFYNRLYNPLNSPIDVRLAAHIGQVVYSDNEMERLKDETVKQVIVYETLAANNSLSVSYNLYIDMEPLILEQFGAEKSKRIYKYRLYKIGIEK